MRFAGHAKNRKRARYAVKRLKTISGRLQREIQRKMSFDQLHKYHDVFALYQRMLNQKRGDKNKLYSLHESHGSRCIRTDTTSVKTRACYWYC